MSETGRRVVQNSLLRVCGYAVGGGLQFATMVLIGRYLGAEGFGHFAFIQAYVGIFQDMGVRNILIRNIAVDRENFRTHLGVARTLLWILALLILGCIVLLAYLLPLTDEVRQSTYLAGLAVVFTFYGLGYSAVLRAFEEMEWDILGFVLHKIIFMALIWAISQTHLGLKGVFIAMLFANASLWLYFWGVVSIRHGRATMSLDLSAGWALLVETFPLSMAEILRRLKQHADKLLLAALGNPTAVGLFSAAYKFLEAMNPFTANLTLPLFPVFSRLAQVSPMRLFQRFDQSLKFLYVMGTPIAALLFVFGEPIIVLFFGETYREAAVSLRVLAPAIMLLLPTAIYGYVFTALGQQRIYTACVAVSLAVNTVVDLLLIPSYGHMGAAIGTLTAEAVLFVAGLVMLARLGSGLTCLPMLWRPLLAGLGMGIVCWLLQDVTSVPIFVGTLGGVASYIMLLLALQTFTQQERTLLTEALRIRLGT